MCGYEMQNEGQSAGELTWIYAKETALKTRWEGEATLN